MRLPADAAIRAGMFDRDVVIFDICSPATFDLPNTPPIFIFAKEKIPQAHFGQLNKFIMVKCANVARIFPVTLRKWGIRGSTIQSEQIKSVLSGQQRRKSPPAVR